METPIEQAFGERLRQVRTLRDMSQGDLGEAIGVEKSTISKYEKGKRGLSVRTLVDISAALNCSPAWLLFGGEDDQPISVGGRVHQASDWWEWLGGRSPLPDEDRKAFFRAATVDLMHLNGRELRSRESTPLKALMREAAAPVHAFIADLNEEVEAAGFASIEDALATYPPETTLKELLHDLRSEPEAQS
jgi:transcriptional regulator with XRE-family HTH domain